MTKELYKAVSEGIGFASYVSGPDSFLKKRSYLTIR